MTLPPEQLENAGRFNRRYPLLCRDCLRGHPGAANAYGAIKDPVFDLMMAQAGKWAAQTAGSAPPGDIA